jgi:hypothetical protein
VAEAPDHLKKNGTIVFEIGDDQGMAVSNILEGTGRFSEIQVGQDLAGKDRVVTAVLAGNTTSKLSFPLRTSNGLFPSDRKPTLPGSGSANVS